MQDLKMQIFLMLLTLKRVLIKYSRIILLEFEQQQKKSRIVTKTYLMS